MQAYLSVAVRQSGRSLVVYLDGELDLASAGQLSETIAHLPGPAGRVIIDLGRLSFIDMAGLRALITAKEQASRAGRRLVLANVPGPVRRVLALAQVETLLPVLDRDA